MINERASPLVYRGDTHFPIRYPRLPPLIEDPSNLLAFWVPLGDASQNRGWRGEKGCIA